MHSGPQDLYWRSQGLYSSSQGLYSGPHDLKYRQTGTTFWPTGGYINAYNTSNLAHMDCILTYKVYIFSTIHQSYLLPRRSWRSQLDPPHHSMMHGVWNRLQLFQLPPAEQLFWGLQLRHRRSPTGAVSQKIALQITSRTWTLHFWSLGRLLEPSWPTKCPSGRLWGASRGISGPSGVLGGGLGTSWALLGGSRALGGLLEGFSRTFGAILEAIGAILEASWTVLKPS